MLDKKSTPSETSRKPTFDQMEIRFSKAKYAKSTGNTLFGKYVKTKWKYT